MHHTTFILSILNDFILNEIGLKGMTGQRNISLLHASYEMPCYQVITQSIYHLPSEMGVI